MVNLVLYRKYRPKSFKEVIGQEHVIQTLTNAISKEMVSHAYLFCGPRGSGKTTVARLLAKAVNCGTRDKKYEPCNKCSSCIEITDGKAIDLIEIDAASHRGIDDVRELRNGIRFTPAKSKYKVFIIDESHQLTKEAANALLKILEEPPSHAIFILATTEIHKMIPTIISRCQRFDFRKLTKDEIIKKLEFICEKEKINVNKSILELIALNSDGAFRDAESLLDQILTFSGGKEIKIEDVKSLLGLVDINLISKICNFIIEKKPAEAINLLNKAGENGLDFQEFTKSLINYLRQMLILKINVDLYSFFELTKEESQKLKQQTDFLKEEEIRKIINIFLDAQNKIRYSSIPQLPLELAIVEICDIL